MISAHFFFGRRFEPPRQHELGFVAGQDFTRRRFPCPKPAFRQGWSNLPRSAIRAHWLYRCAPATIGKVVSADDHELQIACIIDLSVTGIGMQVPRVRSQRARLIVVAIKSTDRTKTFDLSAKVIHCSASA